MGFVAAAYLVGFLVKRFNLRSLLFMFVSMLAGLFIIYLLGTFQLMIVLNLTIYKALAVGIFPFVAFDLIKALLAALVAQRLQKLI